jgi:pimeloyl-ACP methyl ester carboxylesterase
VRLRHQLHRLTVPRRFLIAVCLLLVPLPALALDGDWNGVLATPTARIRLLFHFQSSGGALHATVTSVDQTGGAIAADPATLDRNTLDLVVAGVAGRYQGTVSGDGKTISGTWSQGGKSFPLNLAPGSIAPRPPRAPQPGDLTIAVSGGTLGGTIWRAGDGKLAAVLITGAGPANRDGDSAVNGGRGTYRMIAEGLAAHGITTLSFDKRGVGESAAAAPPPEKMTVQMRGADARAFAAELKKRTGARCVWLIGHSEGGLIAILAAQDNPDICGIVTLAGMGRPQIELFREQLPRTLPEALKPKLMAALDTIAAGGAVDAPELGGLFAPKAQPYMRSEINLDPAALLAIMKFPVLILQGGADEIMGAGDPQALAKARPDATLKILPGVNHSQRIARDDPGTGPTPLAPGLTDTIAAFLKAHA